MGNCFPSIVNDMDEEYFKSIRFLLLGAGESGKSTFFKQIKIIHENGYTEEEYKLFKESIHTNVVQSMKALLTGCKRLKIPIESKENLKIAEKIDSFNEKDLTDISSIYTEDLGKQLTNLWSDSGIQKVIQQSHKFQFFFQEIERISKKDFIPTNSDILRCRVKTIGVTQIEFTHKENNVQIFDVGGQRNERKKWIHCFDNINAIVFLTALNEYDLTCYEDGITPRFDESMKLFEEICHNPFFIKIPIILIMNKEDLFRKKIEKVDLNVWDENYDGGLNYENALNYITNKFLSKNPVEDRKIDIFLCTSTDTDIVKDIFDKVCDSAASNLRHFRRK
eukprot:gene1612-12737_t